MFETINDHGEAVIVTANGCGVPHASWMGTLSGSDISSILTITSPDSRKIVNILENPNVEWMFTSKKLDTVVYLRGKALVICEMDDIERAWKRIKDKSRAYFMQYMATPGMRFLIIETKIEEIEYSLPKENIYKTVKPPFK